MQTNPWICSSKLINNWQPLNTTRKCLNMSINKVSDDMNNLHTDEDNASINTDLPLL